MTKEQKILSILIGIISFIAGALFYACISNKSVAENLKAAQTEVKTEDKPEKTSVQREQKDEQVPKQEIKTSLQPTSVYNIADIAKDTNPCNGETEELEQDKQNIIKNLFDDLADKDYKNASEDLNESGIFSYLSPICSAYHKSIIAIPQKNGVALFTASGNGWPSVPNDTYSFGYLTLSGNKIMIYEDLIKNYFENTTAAEYQKYIQYDPDTEEFNKASKILDDLENKTKGEFEIESFENQALQDEYERFLSQF